MNKGFPNEFSGKKVGRKMDRNNMHFITPAIIIQFVNRKEKLALLKQGRKLKRTNMNMNEHLTKKTEDIAKQAQPPPQKKMDRE